MSVGNTNTSGAGVDIPADWLIQSEADLARRAASIAGSPYVGYQPDRIASLTADQISGQNLARNAAAGTAVDPRMIQNSMAYGLSGFDPNEVNRYMSPFTSGVVNEIGRLGRKELFENVIPGVNTTFSGAGQFGSTRNANFMNTAIQNQNYNTLGQQAKALEDAHTAGLKAYTDWHQNALDNAQQGMNMQLTGANALNTIGTQNQEQNQKSMDLAYENWVNQREYAQKMVDWQSGVIHGTNTPNSSANLVYDASTPASPLMQGAATAGQIYGLFKP